MARNLSIEENLPHVFLCTFSNKRLEIISTFYFNKGLLRYLVLAAPFQVSKALSSRIIYDRVLLGFSPSPFVSLLNLAFLGNLSTMLPKSTHEVFYFF